MLHRLTTNAAGLAAYFDIMADDPGDYLGEGTANGCRRIAWLLHRTAHAADVLSLKLYAARRALSGNVKRLRVEAA